MHQQSVNANSVPWSRPCRLTLFPRHPRQQQREHKEKERRNARGINHGKHDAEQRRDQCSLPASIPWLEQTGLARQHKERSLERYGNGLLVSSRPHEIRLLGIQGRQVRSSMPSTPYNFELCKCAADTKPSFSVARYLVVSGADDRTTAFANDVASLMDVECRSVGLHKRYVMFLCGPVLVCSHGMGGPRYVA